MHDTEPNPPTNDSVKRTGKVMLTIGWILALGVLTYAFGNWERKQFNPNQMPVSTISQSNTIKVELARNRFGHYVASGTINGHAVDFLVDTGATNVAVPEHIAKKIGLDFGPQYSVYTANGTAKAFGTNLNTISLGDIQLQNIDASIVPGMKEDAVLLGMAFLRYVDFSQQSDVLTLTHYRYDAS